jgi:flagellar basal-body rod modification protein FlgD
MAVTGLGGVSATSSTTSVQGLGQDDFLKILLTQLTYQDPLKPLDNQQFIAQMAQFTALEQTRQLNTGMDSSLSLQTTNQAVSLISRTVEVSTVSGAKVGQVTTVGFNSGSPVLTVKMSDGSLLTDLTLSQISIIR